VGVCIIENYYADDAAEKILCSSFCSSVFDAAATFFEAMNKKSFWRFGHRRTVSRIRRRILLRCAARFSAAADIIIATRLWPWLFFEILSVKNGEGGVWSARFGKSRALIRIFWGGIRTKRMNSTR